MGAAKIKPKMKQQIKQQIKTGLGNGQQSAEQSGRGQQSCRCVRLRIGLVLSPAGGALAAMLPAFQAGMGGPLGDGQQMMSWISLGE
jgi:hypothetical protein